MGRCTSPYSLTLALSLLRGPIGTCFFPLVRQVLPVRRAVLVQLDLPDLLALRAPVALTEHKAQLDRVALVQQVQRVPKGLAALPVQEVQLGRKVRPVPAALAQQDPRVPLAQLALRGHKDLADRPGRDLTTSVRGLPFPHTNQMM